MSTHKRLLLVDDEPRNLTLLETMPASLGHELVKANASVVLSLHVASGTSDDNPVAAHPRPRG